MAWQPYQPSCHLSISMWEGSCTPLCKMNIFHKQHSCVPYCIPLHLPFVPIYLPPVCVLPYLPATIPITPGSLPCSCLPYHCLPVPFPLCPALYLPSLALPAVPLCPLACLPCPAPAYHPTFCLLPCYLPAFPLYPTHLPPCAGCGSTAGRTASACSFFYDMRTPASTWRSYRCWHYGTSARSTAGRLAVLPPAAAKVCSWWFVLRSNAYRFGCSQYIHHCSSQFVI